MFILLEDLVKSCVRGREEEKGGHVLRDTLAAACMDEADHLALVRGPTSHTTSRRRVVVVESHLTKATGFQGILLEKSCLKNRVFASFPWVFPALRPFFNHMNRPRPPCGSFTLTLKPRLSSSFPSPSSSSSHLTTENIILSKKESNKKKKRHFY